MIWRRVLGPAGPVPLGSEQQAQEGEQDEEREVAAQGRPQRLLQLLRTKQQTARC